MNPVKESWPYQSIGAGFRFGTVGFGSQFRPVAGSTVLAVAGIKSAITKMSVGYSGDSPERLPLALGRKALGSDGRNLLRARLLPALPTLRRSQAPSHTGAITMNANPW